MFLLSSFPSHQRSGLLKRWVLESKMPMALLILLMTGDDVVRKSWPLRQLSSDC